MAGFCRLIRATSFIWTAWGVRRELYIGFTGHFTYVLQDHDQIPRLRGTCSFVSSPFSGLSGYGYCLQETVNQGPFPHVRKVRIPWKSDSVSLKSIEGGKSKLVVQYSIRIHGRLVSGTCKAGFDENNILYGVLDRKPY